MDYALLPATYWIVFFIHKLNKMFHVNISMGNTAENKHVTQEYEKQYLL